MQVQADVDEADIGMVKTGEPVSFTVDAYPDLTFKGDVQQIRLEPQTVQNVVTYTVVIHVNNPDLKLLPGMTANVTILVDQASDVLRVPVMALRFRPAQWQKQTDHAGGGALAASSGAGGPAAGGATGMGNGAAGGSGSASAVATGQGSGSGSGAGRGQGSGSGSADSSAARHGGAGREGGQGRRGQFAGQGGSTGGARWNAGAGAGGGNAGAASGGAGSNAGGAGGLAQRNGSGGDNAGAGSGTHSRGSGGSTFVFVLENGKPRPVRVRLGVSDGTFTAVYSDSLREGMPVIIASDAVGGKGQSQQTVNPFAPQFNRGGGGGGGGGRR